MTIFRVTMLTSLGIGGSVVVAISLVAALTFLPALLGVLGPRINLYSVVPHSLNSEGMWHRIAMVVMRRPWLVIAGVLAAVTIISLPARNLHVGVPGAAILPSGSQSRTGDTLLQQNLGLANQSPVLVVLKSPTGFSDPATRAGLLILAGKICQRTVVAGVAAAPVVDSPRQIIPCSKALSLGQSSGPTAPRHVALISVFLHADPSSPAAESFVTFLRKQTPPAHVQVLVGGQTAGQLDFDNFIYSQFPLAILFVVVVIFLILAIAFKSILLPIKAILMNFLSVVAAYGATVFAFQEGHLRSLLGFTPTNYLDSIVPIFIFCVLFGLSTDYEVFLLSRVREEYIWTGDNTHSVAVGLEKTGRIITSAAAIMVIIFGAFSVANWVVIKQLGFAMAVGVLVDATLIRALLVPAAMRVLGKWNWWPARYHIVTDSSPASTEERKESGVPSKPVPEVEHSALL
jgi:RND superfamily putative drug exporter